MKDMCLNCGAILDDKKYIHEQCNESYCSEFYFCNIGCYDEYCKKKAKEE